MLAHCQGEQSRVRLEEVSCNQPGSLAHLYQSQIDNAMPKDDSCWHTQPVQKILSILFF